MCEIYKKHALHRRAVRRRRGKGFVRDVVVAVVIIGTVLYFNVSKVPIEEIAAALINILITNKQAIYAAVALLAVLTFVTPFIVRTFKHIKINAQYLSNNIREIDAMLGVDFEKYCKAYFEKQGYKVQLTSASNDWRRPYYEKRRQLCRSTM